MQSPNTAPWHNEYFKLEEFERIEKQESHSDLLSFHLYFPERSLKILLWEVPSLYLDEGGSLLSEGKGTCL